MWCYAWNRFAISFLLFVEIREIILLIVSEGRFFVVCGAPVAPGSRKIDPMSYLRTFGYLPKSDLETHELRSMGEFQSAVRRFQRMSGLRETGNIDTRTAAMMRKPRCGRPDVVGPQEFKAGPSRWKKMDLSYRLLTYTPDLDFNSINNAVREAFRLWTSVSPLNFQQIDNREADLMMSFNTRTHGDGYPFDGKGGILAHAFPPGDGRGGDVHFDEDEEWTEDSDEGTNLFIVAAHEIGHSLGLSHSQVQNSLMFPVYQGYQRNFRLSGDDIEGIQSIYGSRQHPKLTPDSDNRKTIPRRPVYGTSPSPKSPVENDAPPHLCSAKYDAVASIRGEIFVFHGKWFWRLRKDDTSYIGPYLITSFWKGLPDSLNRVDAVFESPTNNRIFFFSGNNYWEFEANNLASGFSRSYRVLRDFGLPSAVDRIDAAFVWEKNRQVYMITDDTYWRLDGKRKRVVDEYPRGMEMWKDVPFPVDAAFTHFDNRTYFIQGSQFWRLEKNTMQVEPGYPQKVNSLWTQCSKATTITRIFLLSDSTILYTIALAIFITDLSVGL